jgi:hypothetical protein
VRCEVAEVWTSGILLHIQAASWIHSRVHDWEVTFLSYFEDRYIDMTSTGIGCENSEAKIWDTAGTILAFIDQPSAQ